MGVLRLTDVVFINEIGKQLCICGILKKFDARPMKSGNQSLTLVLSDKDKEVEVKWFDTQDIDTSFLVCGEIHAITVDVKPYEKGVNGISLIVHNNEIGAYNIDKSTFVNWEDNLQWAYSEMNRLLASVENTLVGKITNKLIKDNLKDITVFPAASTMHHSGLGGLTVHTAGVACACEEMANFYTKIYGVEFLNRNLLICGALLHDIGKIKEFELDTVSNVAEYGLLGKIGTHIMYGLSMITACAVEVGGADTQEVYELLHLIASHHGKLEYGSPIEPNCIEADILSKMDDLDAIAYKRNKAYKELSYGEGKADWKKGGLSVNYRTLEEHREPKL